MQCFDPGSMQTATSSNLLSNPHSAANIKPLCVPIKHEPDSFTSPEEDEVAARQLTAQILVTSAYCEQPLHPDFSGYADGSIASPPPPPPALPGTVASAAPLSSVYVSSPGGDSGVTVAAASEGAVVAGLGGFVQQQHQQFLDGSPDTSCTLYATTSAGSGPATPGQMAYSAVYAALNDGAVAMYAGDGAFYSNGAQAQPVVTQAQLLAGNTYMIQQSRVHAAESGPHQLVTRGGQQTAGGSGDGGQEGFLLAHQHSSSSSNEAEMMVAGQRVSPSASVPCYLLLDQSVTSDVDQFQHQLHPPLPLSPISPPVAVDPDKPTMATSGTCLSTGTQTWECAAAASRCCSSEDVKDGWRLAVGHPTVSPFPPPPPPHGKRQPRLSQENCSPSAAADDQLWSCYPFQMEPTAYDANCVQWLNDNYQVAEGVSLPRSTLYNHYLRHCVDNKLDPVNAASFGKLIRQVFYGLRTRRLGTRGNSKYHYYGIRVKPESPLNKLSDEDSLTRQPATGAKRKKDDFNDLGTDVLQTQQYLGDSTNAVPSVPDIDLTSQCPPDGCTEEDVTNFTSIYREHCEVLLDAVVTLQFSSVEIVWQQFWRSANSVEDLLDDDPEKVMPKRVLYRLCDWPPVHEYVKSMDYIFYQNLVEVLIPDVLRAVPSTLTQSIRNFAKPLESWLRGAMEGAPSGMLAVKLGAVASLAQTLRRYTSLNHLAQAARAVLQNCGQITQMLADLNRVDFANVQEQASWVCQCDDSLVQRLEADFKLTLQQQNSLEQWAAWLESVVATVLKPFENKPEFPKAARQFLLKWSFYSSMVIRDLTLRSAASFGSFHLIRLLYDEYMFYLIENRVARATGEMPIAVMGDRSQAHINNPNRMASQEHQMSDLLLSSSSGPLMDPLCMEESTDDPTPVKMARRN